MVFAIGDHFLRYFLHVFPFGVLPLMGTEESHCFQEGSSIKKVYCFRILHHGDVQWLVQGFKMFHGPFVDDRFLVA